MLELLQEAVLNFALAAEAALRVMALAEKPILSEENLVLPPLSN